MPSARPHRSPVPGSPPARSAVASHIIILNDFAHVEGGGSKVAILSAQALAVRGRQVIFLAAVGPVEPALAAAGVRTICLGQQPLAADPNPLRAAARGLWNRTAADKLRDALRPLDPESSIVHLHGWTKALSGSVIRAALQAGFPLVATLHDYAAVCPNGGFYDYRAERLCHRRPLSAACILTDCDSRRYAHKLWRLVRHGVQTGPGRLAAIPHFINVSEVGRALQAPHLPRDSRLHFVPNPIEAVRAPPAAPAQQAEFLFVGRLAAEKGVRLFAAAARESGLPAAFVGDGYLRAELQRIAPAARISGWLPSREVTRRIECSRALVFPSQWPETQGLAVLEAAARGVPAIVSDGCAACEWVEHGVTGLLFRSGDRVGLQRRMARIAADDALTARLGRRAYERFWDDPPTVDRHAAALARLYDGILQEEGSRCRRGEPVGSRRCRG